MIVAVSMPVPSAPKGWEPTNELLPGHSTTRPTSVATTMGPMIAASTTRTRRRSGAGALAPPKARNRPRERLLVPAGAGETGAGTSSSFMGP